MFDETVTRHLHSGCALLIGTVSADGVPHAARGHGVRVVSFDPPRVRVMLPVDEQLLDNLRATGVIAITSAEVPTLVSMQLKGRVGEISPPGAEDRRTLERYVEQFVHDIVATDGHDPAVVDTWARAAQVVACDVEILEMFDQTPGPGAGALRHRP